MDDKKTSRKKFLPGRDPNVPVLLSFSGSLRGALRDAESGHDVAILSIFFTCCMWWFMNGWCVVWCGVVGPR